MLFFGVGVQYMQKIDMGIAIVCMVNNTALKSDLMLEPGIVPGGPEPSNSTCMFKPTHGNHSVGSSFIWATFTSVFHLIDFVRFCSIKDGPFPWSKQVQGFVLSSYFYGKL